MNIRVRKKRRRKSLGKQAEALLGWSIVLAMFAAGHGALIWFAARIGIYDGSFSEMVRNWLLSVLQN